MAFSDLTDPSAGSAAMDEFDRIGRDNFLQKYGFGPSKSYFVRRDGSITTQKPRVSV
jgi:5-methylcytosine-specific restriction protein A